MQRKITGGKKTYRGAQGNVRRHAMRALELLRDASCFPEPRSLVELADRDRQPAQFLPRAWRVSATSANGAKRRRKLRHAVSSSGAGVPYDINVAAVETRKDKGGEDI